MFFNVFLVLVSFLLFVLFSGSRESFQEADYWVFLLLLFGAFDKLLFGVFVLLWAALLFW